MKKYHSFFIVIVGLLMLSSCSDNDDNSTELSVIGGWTVTESKLNGEIVTNQSVIRRLGADNRLEFSFLINTEDDIEVTIQQGSWSKDGNVLSVDFDNADMIPLLYTITELTSTSMTWELEISGQGTLIETLTR